MQQTIFRKPLLDAPLDSVKFTSRVEVKEINFEPGQETGKHKHPCPVVGYIAEGAVLFQVEGEDPKTLKRGEAFFEPPGKTVVHFDNASSSEPVKFIAFYLLGEHDSELIHMLA